LPVQLKSTHICVRLFSKMNEIKSETFQKQSKSEAINLLDADVVFKWRQDQEDYKKKLILNDTEQWQFNRSVYSEANKTDSLRYVAGLDISFVKGTNTACAGLFVFELSERMNLVYKDISIVQMDLPYVPGFLAYREAPFLLDKLAKLKNNKPELYPQCNF
jgi:hypothetical protein